MDLRTFDTEIFPLVGFVFHRTHATTLVDGNFCRETDRNGPLSVAKTRLSLLVQLRFTKVSNSSQLKKIENLKREKNCKSEEKQFEKITEKN